MSTTLSSAPSTNALQDAFLAILPRIEKHGRVYFRQEKCPDKLQEALAEMVALAWKWFVGLHQRGKDVSQSASALATFAARAVKVGRRLCGQEKARDVLSAKAQQRHHFSVAPLPQRSTLSGTPYEEALQDNTQTPVDEQVAFRMDFPVWLGDRSQRHQELIEDLMLGERTLDVANKYGLTAARISQLRREFQADWLQFCGE